MKNKIKKFISAILFIPNTILGFISGIFVSAGVNVATSQLPNGIALLGMKWLFLMILFFILSLLLIIWLIIVKPMQDDYEIYVREKKSNNNFSFWCNTIVFGDKIGKRNRLLFFVIFMTIISLFALIICMVVL